MTTFDFASLSDSDYGAAPVTPLFTRDQWDRPVLVCLDGQKRAFTRMSGLGKAVEDTGGLLKWRGRMVLNGTAVDPSLSASAALLDEDEPDEKAKLVQLEQRAFELGGGTRAAEKGTALHKLIEIDERGDSIPSGLPGQMVADLDAYRRERDRLGWRTLWAETFVVLDNVGFGGGSPSRCVGGHAGSFDQLGVFPAAAERRGLGGLLIGDIKTGQHHPGKYSGLGYMAQLGGYARSCVYRQGGERVEYEKAEPGHGPVNPLRAVIWWVPVGRAHAELCVVRLDRWQMVYDTVDSVLRLRKERGLINTL